MRTGRTRAVALAVGLVAWNGLVDPRLAARWQPLTRAALGTALVALTRAPLGMRPPGLWTGLRLGAVAAGAVTAAVAATTAVPEVRTTMRERELPPAAAGWLLLRIPLGTVWPEEVAFRGALHRVGAAAFGPDGGQLLQATAFGLSHIADARAAGQPVIGTVVVTGVAGWVLGRLTQRSGGLAAPMLVHLAINEAAALAALLYQRRSPAPHRRE